MQYFKEKLPEVHNENKLADCFIFDSVSNICVQVFNLSWNCQQNVYKILQHFGFVADFSKMVFWFTTFDNLLLWSHVSALCCLHQPCDYQILLFIFFSKTIFFIIIH